MEKIQIKSLVIIFLVFIYTNNCSQTVKTPSYKSSKVNIDINNEENNKRLSEISDIPIPSDSTIDPEETFIIGKGEDWMGKLSLINKANSEEIYNFFLKEMKKYRYKEKSLKKSDISVLILENKKKAIFIKISKFNPGKTYIEITATHVN